MITNLKYNNETAVLILISLLKKHSIKRIIASPGATNLTFVASLQSDPFFTIYSCVDERSAAYMACGMAAESGEPVVISCTGATSSRNYMPGLTEAYHRKLPVLAITSNNGVYNCGHLVPQYVDRSQIPHDVARVSVNIPQVKDETAHWAANVAINRAILELTRNGGGPAHINLESNYRPEFVIGSLPDERMISRICPDNEFPVLKGKKVAIFVGSHKNFSDRQTIAIENFCEHYNSIVICDHTSGYYGRYRVQGALIGAQRAVNPLSNLDVLLHIGEISGDYYSMGIRAKEVWRVSLDGEIRDKYHNLHYVFDMPEEFFFEKYASDVKANLYESSLLDECLKCYKEIYSLIPDLPFSNIWIAKSSVKLLPENSIVHFGILNTLRSWNFFNIKSRTQTFCNVGGFGIDGIISTLIGASLVSPDKTCFAILGDLAFFYDLNSIANRHIGANVRIMMINNGRGTEFTNYGHLGATLGDEADKFVAAAGHFGNKSPKLIKDFATDLGFEYLTASDKETFENAAKRFFISDKTDRPMVFEVFTDSKDESDALKIMLNLKNEPQKSRDLKSAVKGAAKKILGEKGIKIAKIIVE